MSGGVYKTLAQIKDENLGMGDKVVKLFKGFSDVFSGYRKGALGTNVLTLCICWTPRILIYV